MDYETIAKKYGGTVVPKQQTPSAPVDYMSIAKKYGGVKLDSNTVATGLSSSNHWISTALSTVGAVAGGIGGAALGGAAGIETGPGALGTAYVGGVAGSGAGGAAGEAAGEFIESKLGMRPGGVSGSEVAKTGVEMGAFEAVGGPILAAGGKLLEGVAKPAVSAIGKGLSKFGEMFGSKQAGEALVKKVKDLPLDTATGRLSSTEETMTKAERESAIKEGRMTTGGKYTPSKTEQRAGEIMKGKTYSNPVKTVKAVQSEIATRGKAAETHLESNVKKISNKEDFDAFQTVRTSAEKYMTPSEASAYDEQIGVFQKVLKGYAGEGGYNTANYYKALKDYESNVTANLAKGKDALLTPGGSARIQAAKDVRSVVRDMIGNKNPEFKGEMFDLASLYDSLDNVVSKSEKGGHSLSKRYPKTVGAAGALGAYEANKFVKENFGVGF